MTKLHDILCTTFTSDNIVIQMSCKHECQLNCVGTYIKLNKSSIMSHLVF